MVERKAQPVLQASDDSGTIRKQNPRANSACCRREDMILAVVGVVVAFNVSVYLVLATFLTENRRKASPTDFPELKGGIFHSSEPAIARHGNMLHATVRKQRTLSCEGFRSSYVPIQLLQVDHQGISTHVPLSQPSRTRIQVHNV